MARSTIDASTVLAHLLDEPRPDWVDDAVTSAREGRLDLVAPSLLWLEIGNCLVRAQGMADEFALEAMLRTETFGIEVVDISRPIRFRALALAREHELTMYDATYLTVAEVTETSLLTLDARLERAAASMGLGRDGGSKVSEPSAPFGDRPADTTSLAAIGAALAEMRREYSA
jgi:predicted nucleic acid-binding protein